MRSLSVRLLLSFLAVFLTPAVFAHDITSLLVIRFLTGLGLGGALPNVIALTSEFSPHRRRATMVMAMPMCGVASVSTTT